MSLGRLSMPSNFCLETPDGDWTSHRLITKTLSWSILGTLITVIIAYIITGSFTMAGLIGGFERLIKIPLYFLHEIVWERLKIAPKG